MSSVTPVLGLVKPDDTDPLTLWAGALRTSFDSLDAVFNGGGVQPPGVVGAQAGGRYIGSVTGGPPSGGVYQQGDFAIDTGATKGIWLCIDGVAWQQMIVTDVEHVADLGGGTASGSTYFRHMAASAAVAVPTATSVLYMVSIGLRGGTLINAITVMPATAGASYTHSWFGLYTNARANLALSADGGNTAPTANALWTKAMTAPYRVPTTSIYYLGICVTASTLPTLYGINIQTNMAAAGIIPNGSSSTFSAGPVATTPAAITSNPLRPYAMVS